MKFLIIDKIDYILAYKGLDLHIKIDLNIMKNKGWGFYFKKSICYLKRDKKKFL